MLDKFISILRDKQGVNNKYNYLLSSTELKQLEALNKVSDFNETYEKLTNKNAKFRKKDALWAVYNKARLEYEFNKDTTMLSVVFERQTDILINDKKYEQAFTTFISSLYLLLFDYEKSDIDIFDRHFNKRRSQKLSKLLEYTNKTIEDLSKEFDVIIQDNIPSFYNKDKTQFIKDNLIKKIKENQS